MGMGDAAFGEGWEGRPRGARDDVCGRGSKLDGPVCSPLCPRGPAGKSCGQARHLAPPAARQGRTRAGVRMDRARAAILWQLCGHHQPPSFRCLCSPRLAASWLAACPAPVPCCNAPLSLSLLPITSVVQATARRSLRPRPTAKLTRKASRNATAQPSSTQLSCSLSCTKGGRGALPAPAGTLPAPSPPAAWGSASPSSSCARAPGIRSPAHSSIASRKARRLPIPAIRGPLPRAPGSDASRATTTSMARWNASKGAGARGWLPQQLYGAVSCRLSSGSKFGGLRIAAPVPAACRSPGADPWHAHATSQPSF